MLTGKTWSNVVKMPTVRGAEVTRATGETPGTEYDYQVSQDVSDPHGDVDLVVTSRASGKTWASRADWRERNDHALDLWGLLISRLLPSGGAGE